MYFLEGWYLKSDYRLRKLFRFATIANVKITRLRTNFLVFSKNVFNTKYEKSLKLSTGAI
jgi:hypothetical protein